MVIFGAGASFDSSPTYIPGSAPPGATQPDRDNDYNRLPLAKDLFANRPLFIQAVDEFPQCKPILYRLRDPAVMSGDASVEARLQEIEEQAKTYTQGRQELAAIRCYLARAISGCESHWWNNTRGITNHLSLLREIQRTRKTDEPVCLVTFNYDTLLEGALAHPNIGLEIKQMDDYTRRPALFRLFKLHGSVNWGHEVDMAFPANLNMTHPPSVLKHMIEHAMPEQITNRFVVCDPSSMGLADGRKPAFPAIAIPVQQKQIFECPGYMIEELKSVLPHVTRLLVIGWRATEAHFLDLMGQHLKPGALLNVVAVDQWQAEQTRVRIHDALPNNPPSSTAEVATGFTAFMRSARPQGILAG